MQLTVDDYFNTYFEWEGRGDGTYWISVTDEAGRHFQCDYYGYYESGPLFLTDFSSEPPKWVADAVRQIQVETPIYNGITKKIKKPKKKIRVNPYRKDIHINGCKEPEPSLRHMAIMYYRKYDAFTKEEARKLANEYIRKLSEAEDAS